MESLIIKELEGWVELTKSSPRQKHFYEQMLKVAHQKQCVKMKDALSKDQLMLLRYCGYRSSRKECYKNATNMVRILSKDGLDPSIRYVEGLAMSPDFPIAIEHAWVRVGDLFIDPTVERCLKRDVSQWEYVSLIEKDWNELADILSKTGHYGGVVCYSYMRR